MSGMDRLTDETLLPCPFCGGTRATCLNIMMGVQQAMCKDCKSGTGIVRDAATAIAAWNRRASQAAPAPSDGLREAVDAAWNDAIEEVRPVAITCFVSGCDAHELDDAIRALRRAAPTEGEA